MTTYQLNDSVKRKMNRAPFRAIQRRRMLDAWLPVLLVLAAAACAAFATFVIEWIWR